MIDHRNNEIIIVEGLKSYLRDDMRTCEVIRQNQVSKIPPYPYCSYTVTTPMAEHGGGYSQDKSGALYKTVLQTWSFTFQSDDQDEALEFAMKAVDFFTADGRMLLSDNNIVVRRVRSITTRDNLLTNQFEYRNGFDVTFGILSKIDLPEQAKQTIETNEFKEV